MWHHLSVTVFWVFKKQANHLSVTPLLKVWHYYNVVRNSQNNMDQYKFFVGGAQSSQGAQEVFLPIHNYEVCMTRSSPSVRVRLLERLGWSLQRSVEHSEDQNQTHMGCEKTFLARPRVDLILVLWVHEGHLRTSTGPFSKPNSSCGSLRGSRTS